ncbi:putative SP-containing protein [Vairimorpha necatrix]|uniref:SP-containing protein n=1 Tax=Vairimorpha necatrix TaxID=6039 RepID=A0AAX4J950_9MICR
MYFLLISFYRCSVINETQDNLIMKQSFDFTSKNGDVYASKLIQSLKAIHLWNNSFKLPNSKNENVLKYKKFEYKKVSKKAKKLNNGIKDLNDLLDKNFIELNTQVQVICNKLFKHFVKTFNYNKIRHLEIYEEAMTLISLHKIKIEKIYSICENMEFDSNLAVFENNNIADNWKHFVKQVINYNILQNFKVVINGLEHIKNKINRNYKEQLNVLEHRN